MENSLCFIQIPGKCGENYTDFVYFILDVGLKISFNVFLVCLTWICIFFLPMASICLLMIFPKFNIRMLILWKWKKPLWMDSSLRVYYFLGCFGLFCDTTQKLCVICIIPVNEQF